MLSEIISIYTQLTKYCKINNLGPPFTYFEADVIKSNIHTTDLVELDITAAFPTICKFYFGKDHPFVKNIFKIIEKKKRNIYIATTLTEQTKIDNKNYLQELNLWCKILILGYVYSWYDEIAIIEYKKDGLLFKGNQKIKTLSVGEVFNNFIERQNVVFHKTLVSDYMRINKTSFFNISGNLKIKGLYKTLPTYIIEYVLPLLFINGKIYDHESLYEIKEKYSYIYSQILIRSGLVELIEKYYKFSNGMFLNYNGKMTSDINQLHCQSYLTYIIYPILSLLRLKIK